MNLATFEHCGFRIEYRPEGIDRSIITEIAARDDYRLCGLALPAEALVIDVGAHIGVFSCLVAHLFPHATVLACEMDDDNAILLFRNATGRENVHPTHCTVVGDEVPAGYRKNPSNSGGHHIGGPCPAPPSVTLSDLAAGQRIALLKLDCEGAEYGILRRAAADGTLARVDRLAMEYHNFFGEHGSNLVPLLEAAGLRVELVVVNDMCGMIHAVRPT